MKLQKKVSREKIQAYRNQGFRKVYDRVSRGPCNVLKTCGIGRHSLEGVKTREGDHRLDEIIGIRRLDIRDVERMGNMVTLSGSYQREQGAD